MIQIKSFEALSVHELYKILKLRQDVFIIEQKIIYPDIDGRDFDSLHFWVEGDTQTDISSYLRIILNETEKKASIGRVLTIPQARGKGVSRLLMESALDHYKTHYPSWALSLHAQEYLRGFYASLGFVETGPVFYYPDEDPVPHIPMEYL